MAAGPAAATDLYTQPTAGLSLLAIDTKAVVTGHQILSPAPVAEEAAVPHSGGWRRAGCRHWRWCLWWGCRRWGCRRWGCRWRFPKIGRNERETSRPRGARPGCAAKRGARLARPRHDYSDPCAQRRSRNENAGTPVPRRSGIREFGCPGYNATLWWMSLALASLGFRQKADANRVSEWVSSMSKSVPTGYNLVMSSALLELLNSGRWEIMGRFSAYQGVIVAFWTIRMAAAFKASASAWDPALICSR